MSIKDVRSPWSLERGDPHPRRGEIRQGGIYADGGHLVRSPGKGGGPASVSRPDGDLTLERGGPVPVAGGQRDPADPRR